MNYKSISNRLSLSIIVTLLSVVVLNSCSGKVSPFNSAGRTREMVVVLPVEDTDETLKTVTSEVFGAPIPLLPQPEPSLDLIYTKSDNFVSMFKAYRNILVFDIDEAKYTKPILRISYDVWAKGQQVFTAQGPSEEVIIRLLNQRGDFILDKIYKADISREIVDLKDTYSSKFAQEIDKTIPGYTMNIPTDFKWHNISEAFAWASNQGQGAKGRVDIAVYSFPYRDANTFTTEYLIAVRDSVMKANVKGEYENSYMTTEHRIFQAFRPISVRGEYRAEVKGLWAMEGDMMGGPFVMHAFVSEGGQRVIVAECFVYAPGTEKKRLLLWGETSLYTLRPKDVELKASTIFETSNQKSEENK